MKPIQHQVEGLPPGAIMKPINGAADSTRPQPASIWDQVKQGAGNLYDQVQHGLERTKDDSTATAALKGVGRGVVGLAHMPLDIAHAATDGNYDPVTNLAGNMLLMPAVRQAEQAKQDWSKGGVSKISAIGHGAAAALPMVGPMAADAGQKMADTGDVAGGITELGTNIALPEIARGVATRGVGKSYDIVNNALGVKGRDTKFGSNPGRGVVEEHLIGGRDKIMQGVQDAIPAQVAERSRIVSDPAVASRRINIDNSVNRPFDREIQSGLDPNSGNAPTKYIEALQDTQRELNEQRQLNPQTGKVEFNGIAKPLTAMSPQDTINYRSGLGRRINFASNATSQNEVPVMRQSYGGVARDLHQAVPEIAPIDTRLTDLQGAEGVLKRTTNNAHVSGPLINVGDVPIEVLGHMLGGPAGGLGFLGMRMLSKSLPVVSTAAQGVNAVGKAAIATPPGAAAAAALSLMGLRARRDDKDDTYPY